MKRILIRGAQCVLPTGISRCNLLIEGRKIRGIDPPVHVRSDEVVWADGLYLLPGIIDAHVHFREPGLTYKEDLRTATRACVKGGITSFLEMPNTLPPTTTCERLAEKLQLASRKSLVNYGFYIGATLDNLQELQQARRTPGIKIFIGSSTGEMLVDDQAILEQIFAETTLPICAHCEDEQTVRANMARLQGGREYRDHSRIRDEQAAVLATQRAIQLAVKHRHKFHVLHVSTRAEIPLIAQQATWVTGEVCLHHLDFDENDYERLGALVQMNPAIKSPADRAGLWQALCDGRLSMIATDHAPHAWWEKQLPYPTSPSGVPAVENALALMLHRVSQGACTLEQVVRWMSTHPAQIWGIVGKGGASRGIRCGFGFSRSRAHRSHSA
ncbi:MAG: dihydroorotase [Planctomycetaceae bacterium]|nr:MAG: dihydroorotase [Planctomycetaceae bacterium]